jgi:hypothetical protein
VLQVLQVLRVLEVLEARHPSGRMHVRLTSSMLAAGLLIVFLPALAAAQNSTEQRLTRQLSDPATAFDAALDLSGSIASTIRPTTRSRC